MSGSRQAPALRPLPLLLRTGAAQAAVQLMGFLGGLLIVRLLPVDEYATYTILTAALGTLAALADAGIAHAVLARAGRVHADADRVSGIVATGLALRRRFSLLVTVVAAPVFVWMLLHQGLPLTACLVGMAAVMLAFLPMADVPVLEVPLKLGAAVVALQKVQLQSNLLRIGLVSLALWAWPSAALALVCAAIAQCWTNSRLHGLLRRTGTRLGAEPDAQVAAEIRRSMVRTLPGALYFCISAQLNVWLLAVFGSTVAVAQIGALARLAMIFAVLQALVSLLVLPGFAKLPDAWRAQARYYARSIGLLALAGLGLSLAAWLFPQPALWLLGRPYSGLGHELVLMIAAGAASLIASASHALNNARGYLPPAFVHPLLGASHTLALMLLLDVSTVRGVLGLQLVLAVFSVLYSCLIFVHYARKSDRSDPSVLARP